MQKNILSTLTILLTMSLILTACGDKSETDTSVSGNALESTEEIEEPVTESTGTGAEAVEPTEEPASTEDAEEVTEPAGESTSDGESAPNGETSATGEDDTTGGTSATGGTVATPAPTTTPTPTPPPHTHSYSSAVTSQPTCAGNGVNTFTCSCGDSYTESIPAIGHNWSPATCTTPKTCTTCGATEGSAIAHNFVNYTCTMCGQTECSLYGHDYQDHEETIHHPGEAYQALNCHDCGAIYNTASEMVVHQSAEGHCGYGTCFAETDSWDEVIHNWICSRCGATQ